MSLQDVKALGEKLTGMARPRRVVPRRRKAHPLRFADDGGTPNNPHLPVILYRSPVKFEQGCDPAALFEVLFAAHGWKSSWRDGIYDFNHFHTGSHEVLGIARGQARVRLGGRAGRVVDLKAGDVLVLPAGTGHQRLSKSKDLLVVGAYPSGGAYDEPGPGEVDHQKAVARIAKVRLPAADPVYGAAGPLKTLWRKPH